MADNLISRCAKRDDMNPQNMTSIENINPLDEHQGKKMTM